MAETSKNTHSEDEAFEKIDQAKEKVDTFSELVLDITNYLSDPDADIKIRLSIERRLKKYQEQNTPDWLLNIILRVANEFKNITNK